MELGAQESAGTISRTDAENVAYREYRAAGSPPIVFPEPPPSTHSQADAERGGGGGGGGGLADASANDAFESGAAARRELEMLRGEGGDYFDPSMYEPMPSLAGLADGAEAYPA